MKIRDIRAIGLTILCFSAQPWPAAYALPDSGSCPYNFAPLPIDKDDVKVKLGNSVLRLTDPVTGGLLGTGFVIDANAGLFITAEHVARQTQGSCEAGTPLVIASTDRISDLRGCYLRGLLTENNIDLAIMQLDSWPAGSQIDVSFRYPRDDEEVRILGYPQIDNRLDSEEAHVKRVLRAGETFQDDSGNPNLLDHAMIKIDHKIWHGHSGSPAISLKDGMVFAVARALGESNIGYYEPLDVGSIIFRPKESSDLLLSSGAKEIFTLVSDVNSKNRILNLAAFLDDPLTRNVDMLIFVSNLLTRTNAGESFDLSDVIYCPLQKFLAERGIIGVYPFLTPTFALVGLPVTAPLTSGLR